LAAVASFIGLQEMGRNAVITKYEIRSGKQVVSVQDAYNANQAVTEYVRGLGCRDDELVRLGLDSVAWRGARFRAVPADQAPSH
jgi:hypothetical protein